MVDELRDPDFPVPEICITVGVNDIIGPVLGVIVDEDGEQAEDSLAQFHPEKEVTGTYVSPDIPKNDVRNLDKLTESVSIDNIDQIEQCLRDGSINTKDLLNLLTNFLREGTANNLFVIAPETRAADILVEKLKKKALDAFLESVKETIFENTTASEFVSQHPVTAVETFASHQENLKSVLFSDDCMNAVLSHVSKHFQNPGAINEYVFSDVNVQNEKLPSPPSPPGQAAEVKTTMITGDELKALAKDKLPDVKRIQSITFLASARPRGGKMTYGVRAKMGDKNWHKNVSINLARADKILKEHLVAGNSTIDNIIVLD